MATWYARTSDCNFDDVSAGTTSSVWNAAADGSGAWLDLASDFTADTFRANANTGILLNVDVTCAEINGLSTGSYLINSDVTITANLRGGTVATFLMNSGTPAVEVVGNVTAGAGTCINISVAGTLTVTGNVTGGSAAAANGITATAAAVVAITGNVTGGSNIAAHGVSNTVNALDSLSITGNVTAATGRGVQGLSTPTTITAGNIVDTGTQRAIHNVYLTYVPDEGDYYRVNTTAGATLDLVYGTPGAGGGMAVVGGTIVR